MPWDIEPVLKGCGFDDEEPPLDYRVNTLALGLAIWMELDEKKTDLFVYDPTEIESCSWNQVS